MSATNVYRVAGDSIYLPVDERLAGLTGGNTAGGTATADSAAIRGDLAMSDTTNVPSTAVSRRRALQAGVGVAGAAWIAPVVFATPAAAASPGCVLCGSNLLINPNGASYTGTITIDTATTGFAQPTGWALTNNFRVVLQGSGSTSTNSVPVTAQFSPAPPPSVPPQFFSGSFTDPYPNSPGTPALSTATQVVDVSACAMLIDAGSVAFTLSGWLGGFVAQNDVMTLSGQPLDGSSVPIGGPTSMSVTPGDRAGVTRMLFRTGGGTLPNGTRSVRVVMSASMTVMPRYNAFATLLDFRLSC